MTDLLPSVRVVAPDLYTDEEKKIAVEAMALLADAIDSVTVDCKLGPISISTTCRVNVDVWPSESKTLASRLRVLRTSFLNVGVFPGFRGKPFVWSGELQLLYFLHGGDHPRLEREFVFRLMPRVIMSQQQPVVSEVDVVK